MGRGKLESVSLNERSGDGTAASAVVAVRQQCQKINVVKQPPHNHPVS